MIHQSVAGKTQLVAMAVDAFEKALKAIRQDQEPVFVVHPKDFDHHLDALTQSSSHEDKAPLHSSDDNPDLFHAAADAAAFVEYYQKQCVSSIEAYTEALDRLVKEAVRKPEKTRNSIPAMDRAMTVGRVASNVEFLGSTTIHRALLPPPSLSSSSVLTTGSPGKVQQHALSSSSIITKSNGVSSFAQERAAKARVDGQVEVLTKRLLDVYFNSHDAWIESVEFRLRKSMHVYLEQSSWSELPALAWEPMPTSTISATTTTTSSSSPLSPTGGSPRSILSSSNLTLSDEANKTLLPIHGSTRLMAALYQIVQEMHRVGTGFMRPELVQRLTKRLVTTVFHTLDKFLLQLPSPYADVKEGEEEIVKGNVVMTERGAIQLLFDIKFLNLVFQTQLEGLEHSKSVMQRVRAHIDPINLAVFEKPLETNAERLYSRVSALLGLLVQLNPVESKRKQISMEKSPHIFAMAPLTARFTLLPIGQKMSSGRVV
ncbi:Golgi transport complex subunit 1 [Podila epigama]|nr:Golgi transport complex subunit 1 [Podila epigama]